MVDLLQSCSCSCWDCLGIFSRFNLQFTFIKNVYISIFFILKILTDFRKTVETGMDPRLVMDFLAKKNKNYSQFKIRLLSVMYFKVKVNEVYIRASDLSGQHLSPVSVT